MKHELISEQFKEAFLEGDTSAILTMGDVFMRANGKAPIPHDKIDAFVDGWSPEYLHETGDGWGMSTADAIRCLYDVHRTTTFIKGIKDATNVLKKQSPNKPLVAGCGTGILAIAAALSGVEKVTALEINPVTATHAKNFIAALGLEEKITVIQADATTYAPEEKADILITENMHTGLFLEPQAQVLQNLRQYMEPQGILLPESVGLHFTGAQANWDEIDKPHTEFRGVAHLVDVGNEYSSLPKIDFYSIDPEKPINGLVPLNGIPTNALLVEMDVHVFGEHVIKSGHAEFLGQPHIVRVGTSGKGDLGFFSYMAGVDPLNEVTIFERE